MYPERPFNTLFNLPRIISALNRTLNTARQIIPIYKEAKPMVNNIKNAFSTVKTFASNQSKIVENAMLEEIQMQNNIPNIISENYYISIRLKPNIYLIIYSNPKEKFNYVFCIVMEKNTLLM